MTPRPCLDCGTPSTGTRCPRCRQREWQRRRRATSGWEWNAIRRSILDRDRHRCRRCGATTALEVHHRIPLAAGGTNAPENLIVLCHACHRQAELPPPPTAA